MTRPRIVVQRGLTRISPQGASEIRFADFVERYDELVVGARDNTLAPEAYQGANITLTNPGGLGTVASVPRLMPGQGTIVATGAIGYPPGLGGVAPAAASLSTSSASIGAAGRSSPRGRTNISTKRRVLSLSSSHPPCSSTKRTSPCCAS